MRVYLLSIEMMSSNTRKSRLKLSNNQWGKGTVKDALITLNNIIFMESRKEKTSYCIVGQESTKKIYKY